MGKRNLLFVMALAWMGCLGSMQAQEFKVSVSEANEPMAEGLFKPTWESLSQYRVPKWFEKVKFGIWAHWGPQCVPASGDWNARKLYIEGSPESKYHREHYGHPSEFGFKDILPLFKAERWNPDSLMAFYKKVGAQYFFALGNHHDNFDLWDSKYQPWNAKAIGPKRDLLAEWAEAARRQGLYFGVSFHAEHAWRFYESSQLYDRFGDKAGVQYDGRLTKADGKGKWWEGLDPQDLYAQNHRLSELTWADNILDGQWEWQNGVCLPSVDFCTNFYDRTVDAINRYNPDLIYFDCAVAPLYPFCDAGLKIAAHYYNHSMARNKGQVEGVMFGKWLAGEQAKAMVKDVERGSPNCITELPWQTCSCIGDWHYKTSVYEQNAYKSPVMVVRMLVDIISKNGRLLLSVPLRADGTFDEKEEAILNEFAEWMATNKESIYDTRPWHIYGEGPIAENADPDDNSGWNEGTIIRATEKDIRFNQNDRYLYITALDWPSESKVTVKALAQGSRYFSKRISRVELLGYGNVPFSRTKGGLAITVPKDADKTLAPVFRIKK